MLKQLSRAELAAAAHGYLRDCFRAQSPPRASELAARVGASPVQLSRMFVRLFGQSPAHYLKLRQIERAKRLLRGTALSTNQVAYRAGFGTRATFFRLFRRVAGFTPARWRVG